jgi:Uma2 family endonuclease
MMTMANRLNMTERKITYKEFLDWADEDTHAEWVNGDVFIFEPVSNFHQNVIEFLFVQMNLFVGLLDLGKVRVLPFQMRLENSGREPDIMFIYHEQLGRLTEDYLDGPADLVVEVVSPDTVRRDREEKFREYRVAGVTEYWIIDPLPEKRRADFYYLDANGDFVLIATEDEEQVFSKVLKGFWIRPSWLWQTEEISPFATFCEICGLTTEQINEFHRLLFQKNQKIKTTKSSFENKLADS